MRVPSIFVAALALAAASSSSSSFFRVPIWRDPSAPVNDRVASLLAELTLEEKVNQLLCPWPVANFTQEALATWGNTSFGSAMWNGINDPDGTHGPTHFDVVEWFQAQVLARSRLPIPVVLISEILHSSTNNGTIFPAPAGLGATWDPSLIQLVGSVIAQEARAAGIQRGFGPVLQVATDPRFGRFEESYGEDPFLVSAFAEAMVTGLQGSSGGPSTYVGDLDHISVELKHAAAYAQAGRDGGAVLIDEDTLWNVYLRPWKRAIGPRVGARGLMVTHPEVNGLPAHANPRLLTDILRGAFGGDEMLFASDAGDIGSINNFGVADTPAYAAILGLVAGMDQDNAYGLVFPTLLESVTNGSVPAAFVDRAAANVLREKVALGFFDGDPSSYLPNKTLAQALLDSPPHRALAYQAGLESIVLLQNGRPAQQPQAAFLPLRLGTDIKRVAIIGPNAGCDSSRYSWTCNAPKATVGGYSNDGAHVVTVLEAAQRAAAASQGAFTVSFAMGANITTGTAELQAEAVALAAASDVAVVVVGDTATGYRSGSCSEGEDADTLELPGGQLPLLQALVAQTATPVVVVLIHGRPVTFGAALPAFSAGENNALLSSLSGLVAAWRPGEEGGSAVWAVLNGTMNPSGRLTQNWVRTVGDIRSPSNPYLQPRGNDAYPWTSGPATPLFPFGFGLSYSTFAVKGAALVLPNGPGSVLGVGDAFQITGNVTSSGPAGALVVQVYFSQRAPTKWVRFQSQLLCFSRVPVPANSDGAAFTISCAVEDMEVYDRDVDDYVVFSGAYTVTLGTDSTAASQVGSWEVQVAGNSPWSPGTPWERGTGVGTGKGRRV